MLRIGLIPLARAALDELLALKSNFSRAFVEWLPFVDRTRIGHLLEGQNADLQPDRNP